jgi:two-component system, chemotaxis family, chemotaxis protein CheY
MAMLYQNNTLGYIIMIMSKKILIVDDDPLIRSTLEQSLIINGFAAMSAIDGSAGLEAAREWMPDLIILDHRMPAMTGIEFLKLLRADPKINKLQVIYLTSDDDILHINEAIELGVNTYLNKRDVQMNDIVKAITDALK